MQKLLPPVLVLITAAAMVAAHALVPIVRLFFPAHAVLALLLAALGIALAVAGRIQFTRARTTVYTFDEPGTLVTGGVYRLSRNPMYLGLALMLLGLAAWLGSASALLLALGFVAVTDRWYIRYEESLLERRFGADYARYRRRTRRWL